MKQAAIIALKRNTVRHKFDQKVQNTKHVERKTDVPLSVGLERKANNEDHIPLIEL